MNQKKIRTANFEIDKDQSKGKAVFATKGPKRQPERSTKNDPM
jgi:hypothetical protein